MGFILRAAPAPPLNKAFGFSCDDAADCPLWHAEKLAFRWKNQFPSMLSG